MPDPDPGSPAARKPREWDKHARPAAPSRSGQLLTTLFLLAAVAGLIVWFVRQPAKPPEPSLFSVAIEEFTNPRWPAAAGVHADGQRLAAAFPNAGRSDTTTRAGKDIRSLLNELEKTAADRPLVLHVGGLAAVRGDAAFLIPADDLAADRGANWVPVADVLDALDRCPSANKLLLLDVARPVGDPFTGQLRDDTAAVLDRLLQARKPKYPVFTSCGPGQFSLPVAAPEKGSVFGMYLADGLRGLADGADGSTRNDQVTVRELVAFVRSRVYRYSRSVWGTTQTQTPRLYEPAAAGWDFVLTGPLEPAKPHDPLGEPDRYPDRVAERWAFLDQRRAAGDRLSNPRLFAESVALAARSERRWLATGDVKYAVDDVPDPAARWSAGQKPLAPAAGPADVLIKKVGGFRLATRLASDEPPPDWKSALDAYVVEVKTLKAKTDPTAAERTRAELARANWLAKATAKPQTGVALAWRQASAGPRLTREDAEAYSTAISDVWGDRPPTLEMVYLAALAKLDFVGLKSLPRQPETAVAGALMAEDRLGQALAAGPDGFAAVRDRMTAADQTRQEAMRLLFEGETTAATDRAAELFRQAADGFTQAGRSARQAQHVARSTATALGELVDKLPAALRDEQTFKTWLETAALAKGLTAGAADPTVIDRVTDGLRRLDAPFEKGAVQKLLNDEKQRKESPAWTDPDRQFAPYLRLVAGPVLPADQRREVWELVRKKRRELHNIAREADDQDDKDDKRGPTLAPPDRAEPTDDRLTQRRAEASLALLELTGSPAVAKARTAVEEYLKAPDGPRAEAAGAALAAAWAGVRTGRIIPPEIAADGSGGPAGGGQPDRRPDSDEYMRWVARQFEGYLPLRAYDPDNRFFGRLPTLTPN
ncbi:MAG: hypothetical protein U0871_24590 [Gemmataceae bacterium]